MAIGKAARWISFAAPQQTPSSSAVAHDIDHSTHSIADEKQFGLENFGNTCYANSVLQALYFCPPFRDLVIQSTDISAPPLPAAVSRQTPPPLPTANPILPRRKSERGKTACDVPSPTPTPTPVIPSAPPTLFSALRSLYVFISRNPVDKGAVAPRAFIDKLRDGNEHFRGVMHQDAHEFLNYLLNKIVEEIQYDKHHKHQDKDKDSSSSNASREDLSSTAVATLVSNNAPSPIAHSEFSHHSGTLVHRLFEGTLTSETRCLTCETVSSRDESFLDLSIDIEQNSSVTACLRQFSASEMLCQRNKFFCDSCCGLQEAEKRMKIKKLPNVLALHLKRFKYQEDLKKYVKLTYRVAFPFELRLFNTADDVEDPDRLYELFGIVVHIGSGPHHGHYVAIVKGPHSWLVFDDDKIDAIKESEIPRYFGDATSGSAYVLYYQAVDLDPASLGIKVLADPTVPDITIAGSPAVATTTNGMSSLELPDPALPPGLGESPAASPAAEPTPHPPILTAPSSPTLVTMPLVASVTLPSRKKSLPSIRIPAPDSSNTPTATSSRAHGGLFNTFRSSPSGSRTRPSTSDGTVSTRGAAEDPLPPVPPVPLQFLNGKDTKEHDKDKDRDKGGEKEREEERSSKEFERRPSLWFKRRTARPTKEEREKEKDKDKEKEKEKEKEPKANKDKDVGSTGPGHATASAAPLAAAPSQSDAAPSASGASSLWRRSSARVGYHVKRLSGSGTNSSTTLGDTEATVAAPPAGVSSGSSSSSHPPPHPHPHSHSHHHPHLPHHHHHHPHHHLEPPGQLPTVPATQSDWEPSTPSSTSSSPPATGTIHAHAQHRPPPLLASNTDDDELPSLLPLRASGEGAGVDGSSPLPAWRISPASPPGESSGSVTSTTSTSAVLPHHHSGEPTSMVDHNDEVEDDDNDDVVSDDHEPEHDPHENEHEHEHRYRRLRAPTGLRFFAGRRRRRRHSAHGSGSGSGGSGSPRERSTSPHQQHQGQRQEVAATVPSPQSPPAPESSGGMNFPSQSPSDTPAPAPSSSNTSSSSNSAPVSGPAAGLRRAARKLSLMNAPLFGLGLGLGLGLGGGRDKDRDPHHHSHSHPPHEHHQHQHLGNGKKEESGSNHKAPHKIRMPSSFFGSGGSGADAGVAVGVSAGPSSALP